jgi:hypothetical protein
MGGSVLSDNGFKPAPRLIFIAALMAFMCLCVSTLRFTRVGLNIAFVCLLLLLPFFAIKPALRLRRWAKIATLALLMPLLALSLTGLFGMVACEIPAAVNHRQLSRELCALHQGQSSVYLAWEETAGGAVGPHGVTLEQRRTILPGIYAVKTLDYFGGASEGTLSWAGPERVSLDIPVAGYDQNQKNIQREYSLKPWLYF